MEPKNAPLVLIERETAVPVETIKFNRPEKRNALSFDALRALHRELRRLATDREIRVVLLRGAGGTFCAGMDLREASAGAPVPRDALREFEIPSLEREPDPVPVARVVPRLVQEAILRVKFLPQIVLGVAEGAAYGGGAGLLSACDLVAASDDFRAGFSEVKLGFLPALLEPFLSRALAPKLLYELDLTSRPIDAKTARELGLVGSVVPKDRLEAEIQTLVETLLARNPDVLAETKRLFAKKTAPTPNEVDAAWKIHCESFESESGRRGVARFFGEKSR